MTGIDPARTTTSLEEAGGLLRVAIEKNTPAVAGDR